MNGKVSLAALLFLLWGHFLSAQQAIDARMLKQFESSVKKDTAFKAIVNAASNNDISKLVVNRERVGKVDSYFAHRIKTDGVTNQKSSGRCWLFSALNVLRPSIIKAHKMKRFEFSENYLFFYDQLEKANLFLEAMITHRHKPDDDRMIEWLFKHPIGDGGVWNMMTDLIKKYGAVPKQAMPESYNPDHTRWLRRMLQRKLRKDGYRIRQWKNKSETFLRRQKTNMLAQVYRMLVIALGEPPKTFRWRYETEDGAITPFKTYTPNQFFREFVADQLDDYVMLMNDPSRPFYQLYEIEYDRNCYEGHNWKYVNVPISVLKSAAKKSILDDEPMYYSCDVGKQLNREDGILAMEQYDYSSLFGVDLNMTKTERIRTFESGSTHGMALMGVDTAKDGRPVKWLLENSWGEKSGFEGYLIMTDRWFDNYTFRLVVRRKYLDDKTLKALNQKAVKLPPWDAMF